MSTDLKWRKSSAHAWVANPFTVRRESDPRTREESFELFDSTRFVQAFASARDARRAAENLNCGAREEAV